MSDEHETQAATGVREGEVLAGKYRIDKVLGVGGMGVVIAGRHLHLDERVAVKFLLPQALANPEAVARFAREARAAVKIKSEHVARVTDVGTLDNGAPYMVMEYLEGGDLSAWLKQKGKLSVEQAVDFVLQASEAIAEAHALGIVHRDLKPANLFVIRRPDGALSVKVLDFGISKAKSGIEGSDMTRTSAVMGSPLYMSPEQMQSSKGVDPRTDIWALGVVLFELITGELPFTADSMPELVLKIVSSPPQALLSLRPDVPPGLEAVLLKCLEKDRGNRYATIGDFALSVSEFGSRKAKISVERIAGVMREAGLSSSDLLLAPSSGPNEARGAGTDASWGSTGANRKGRSNGVLVATIATVAAVTIGGGFMAFGRRSTPAPASSVVSPQQLDVALSAPKPPDEAPLVRPAAVDRTIVTEPAQAIVTVDGTDVGKAPYKLTLPESGRSRVTVRAAGYHEVERIVTASNPAEVSVKLSRKAEPDAKSPKPPSAPRLRLAPR